LTGIGPKTAELLNQSGVISFAQLAAMSTEALHTFLQDNNIPHSKAKVANWPQQAAQMAAAEQ
jgi:predicted flap endonuclease-1-like 5' DNA nuclease